MSLPPDSHIHTEWSWDALHGSMEQSCAQALRLRLPAIAFTDHLDHTAWTVGADGLVGPTADEAVAAFSDAEGRVTPPNFDASGYLDSVERCRAAFPDLQILSGLEIGEPHWHASAVDSILASGTFDRVLGSLHCLPDGDALREPGDLYSRRAPGDVMRDYLAEVARLVNESDSFSVLAHIDYPVRAWPAWSEPFDPAAFEDDFRYALRVLALSGRILEVNTVVPLDATILRWWHDEGGEAVTFGSDAHDPLGVARGFTLAAHMAEAIGFRSGESMVDPWPRS